MNILRRLLAAFLSLAIASYAYTLDASGHRLTAAELSGRNVTYAYDNLYRLTSETVASDPHSINGAVSYTYDPVGNRTQKTSTLPGFPGGTLNYNTNDQLTHDVVACPEGIRRDANGNTTTSNSLAYAYDFENHLIQQGGITIVYDGDGNRASKTVGGITSTYLVDTQNPTGYAQVLQESFTGNTGANFESLHTYVYGLERISERRNYVANNQGATANAYYVYDGHGSVRALAEPTGTVTDTYDYDAFGVLLHSTGTTPNNYLYSGEQFDPDLGLYYNRARYLNTSTGRFWTMDTFEGDSEEPSTLQKYLETSADPVDRTDPSGLQDSMAELGAEFSVMNTVSAMATRQVMAAQKAVQKNLLKLQFTSEFASAVAEHASAIGWFPGGSFGDFIDSFCQAASILTQIDCARGCIARRDWTMNTWFPEAKKRHVPDWNGITLEKMTFVKKLRFPHNFARANFPDPKNLTPLILDGWRSTIHPAWEQEDYVRSFGPIKQGETIIYY